MNPNEITTFEDLMNHLMDEGFNAYEAIDFLNDNLSKLTTKQVILEVCEGYNEMIDEVVEDEEELEDEV